MKQNLKIPPLFLRNCDSIAGLLVSQSLTVKLTKRLKSKKKQLKIDSCLVSWPICHISTVHVHVKNVI